MLGCYNESQLSEAPLQSGAALVLGATLAYGLIGAADLVVGGMMLTPLGGVTPGP